eukprot:CAMPEP_0119315844 /NCGR_PEP_ID=MMETSP1333-20130426/37386_1 /TAXON_ID=418940 /ORGANISM="Scyphosphaera apsteinii, Strain RCC1455" /LENGTH=158 /DNA_ID=CAMNT_0007321319 /DNA_START=366 /DNA_END=842 /DNA_ORIENTATION=+
MAFSALELVALSTTLTPARLAGLLLLQAVIVVGFWTGILIATCTDSFSFLPVDRHLRQLGLIGTLRNPSTRYEFLRAGLAGHLVLQLLFGMVLMQEPQVVDKLTTSAAMAEMVWCIVAYIFVTLAGAVALPPHRLPYQLGVLPSWLQWGSLLMRASRT